jgi:3-phenylpropionate/cinnamic acid dioxygenase small subunit
MTPQELSDHQEIAQNLYRYARAVDTRNFDLLDGIFTADALIRYDVPGGRELSYPNLKEWLAETLAIFQRTQHVISNPLIELSGDAARSTCYLTAKHVQIAKNGNKVVTTQGGIYSDVHARTTHGWRISRRTLSGVYVLGTFLGPDEVQRT